MNGLLDWPEPILPKPIEFPEPEVLNWDGPFLITTRRCGPFVFTTTQALFGYAQKAITA